MRVGRNSCIVSALAYFLGVLLIFPSDEFFSGKVNTMLLYLFILLLFKIPFFLFFLVLSIPTLGLILLIKNCTETVLYKLLQKLKKLILPLLFLLIRGMCIFIQPFSDSRKIPAYNSKRYHVYPHFRKLYCFNNKFFYRFHYFSFFILLAA